LGGGKVLEPMRIIIGDRATRRYDGHEIEVGEIAESTSRAWLKKHLRFIEPSEHLVVQNELREGSAELTGIFAREKMIANDTSVGVGFAPLSETESLVLSAERFLNSADFKHEFPEAGEDVKIMGIRTGRTLQLTVAVAIVDRFLFEEAAYWRRKEAVKRALAEYLESKLHGLDSVQLEINALDDPSRGSEGMYLTVLGTSAESADGGQVGRGNRVNGLISLSRPMTLEAAAGKNPVSHVGKVYNLLAHELAEQIYQAAEPIEEVQVWLCSRIGQPLDNPWSVSVELAMADGVAVEDVKDVVRQIVERGLSDVTQFTQRLTRGELAVC
jgi:S-adenosylmethionine synthetase